MPQDYQPQNPNNSSPFNNGELPDNYENSQIPPASNPFNPSQPLQEPQPPIQEPPQQSGYPQFEDSKPNDLISKYTSNLRKHPGKSGYIFVLTLSLIFTFLPWIGTFLTNNSYNYYYFIGKNIFVGLYFLGILALIGIRIIHWKKLSAFNPYLKIIDYIETLLMGAILMFTLTIGVYGDLQFGLLFSVITNLMALCYLTYIKIIKPNQS